MADTDLLADDLYQVGDVQVAEGIRLRDQARPTAIAKISLAAVSEGAERNLTLQDRDITVAGTVRVVTAPAGPTITPTVADSGSVFVYSSAGTAATFSMPTALGAGWQATIVQGATAAITVTGQTGATVKGNGDKVKTNGIGAVAHVVAGATSSYYVWGDVTTV